MASVKIGRGALLFISALCLGLAAPPAHTATVAPTEQQLKAVFVFNFSHFVTWPADSFAAPSTPFVIGVLGGDAFAAQLEEAVRNERIDTHPLVVQRFHSVEEIRDCKILYIDRAQGADLDRALSAVSHHSTLTVSDLDDAAARGTMIQLATQDNRIRLLINPDSARDAGLTISSNLLRLAKIVRTTD